MRLKTILLLSSLFAIAATTHAQTVEVLSGGYKTRDQALAYIAKWTYVFGYNMNGGWYYNPSDEPGVLDHEVDLTLSEANARWASNDLGLATLHDAPYYFTYCTASVFATSSTLHYDDPWPSPPL